MKRVLLCIMTAALLEAREAAVGLAADGQVIQAILPQDARQTARVLLIGGLDGIDTLTAQLRREKTPKGVALTVIPRANPANRPLRFPPSGDAYRENPEAHSIWRFIAATAPDLVLVAGPDTGGLVAALEQHPVAGIAKVPAQSIEAKRGFLGTLQGRIGTSALHQEQQRRLQRNPRQVAELLAKVYGQDLKEAVYIPAFALQARLRLGHLKQVEEIVTGYRDGTVDSLAKPSSSHFSGHLIFADLAEKTANARYVELVKKAAGFGFEANGEMKESMPLHSQMSDSVFMGCPILVKAGNLTGDSRYYDMAWRHFQFMRRLDLRPDGLWRHSPLDEAAWGRGNAFALLGMALTLANLPAERAGYAEILAEYQKLALALLRQQDEAGMWRQVVDHRGAYREFSATAMIGRALLIGVRRGWLDKGKVMPAIDRAWVAINARTSDTGELLDVCESTGAQKTLQDYLRRKAVLGVDARGGAMVMLFATELAGLQ